MVERGGQHSFQRVRMSRKVYVRSMFFWKYSLHMSQDSGARQKGPGCDSGMALTTSLNLYLRSM